MTNLPEQPITNVQVEPEVTSTGSLGFDWDRSYHRAYANLAERFTEPDQLIQILTNFQAEADQRGRRRSVLRCVCSEAVVQTMTQETNQTLAELLSSHHLSLEVVIPLNLIHPESSDYLVMFGRNVHPTRLPEWPELAAYWQSPNGSSRTPLERLSRLPAHFQLIDRPRSQDVSALAELWHVFEWSPEGVARFIANFEQSQIWFSGVVDTRNDQLVAACMGEALQLNDQVTIVETTEYSTTTRMQPELPSEAAPQSYQGHGLCTSALIGLQAQILRDTYHQTGQLPLINAELNVRSRSDIAARHAGMIIPILSETTQPISEPIQVLFDNVAVEDGQAPNDLQLADLPPALQPYFAHIFDDRTAWLRSFIMGILPMDSVTNHYHQAAMEYILSRYQS